MSSVATQTATTEIDSSITTDSGPFLYTNTTVNGSFLGQPLFNVAIIVFILILVVIAVYLLYLHFCTARRRLRPSVFSSKFFKHKDPRNYLARPPPDEMIGQPFFGGQQSPASFALVNKELNLQPAANDVVSMHEEFRSIIASKLKKPPSTLETLIEPNHRNSSMDVEIKPEQENDDVFSVISAKSLERYRAAGRYKADKSKMEKPKKEAFENSDTTESENVDKVIVLKSGSNLDASLKGLTSRLGSFRSRSKLGRRSRRKQSKTGIKKIG